LCYKFHMFVDSHCHLEMDEYDQDRENVIALARQEGISSMLTVGTERRYFAKVLEIIESHPSVFGAIGVHPHNAAEYSDALESEIKGILTHSKIVGYGEIGLDFYRNYAPQEVQMTVFRRQIEVARTADLPIIIHSRNARAETMNVLREAHLNGHPTIVHCYSYDIGTARDLLDMGMYLSIPGTLTYKTSLLPEIVRYVPLDRLLSETDAPFLSPHPHRGERNQPAFVRFVVEEIARIKEQSVAETARALSNTFHKVFSIPKEENH
jgi:TatD DNase family protein